MSANAYAIIEVLTPKAESSVVGAGAAVVKNIGDHATVKGVPAR